MKNLPQKQRPAPPRSSSTPDFHIQSLDLDEVFAEADAKSDEWRPSNRAARKATTHAQEDDPMGVDQNHDTTRSEKQVTRKKTISDHCDFDDFIDLVDEESKLPSLHQNNSIKVTDNYLTPHGTDDRNDESHSIGNPSTITHLSDTVPRLSEPYSSSSQVPHSSPALDRARRGGREGVSMISPRPVRAVSGDIAKLEKMVGEGQNAERDDISMVKLGRMVAEAPETGNKPVEIKMERVGEGEGRSGGRANEDRYRGGGRGNNEREIRTEKAGGGGLDRKGEVSP